MMFQAAFITWVWKLEQREWKGCQQKAEMLKGVIQSASEKRAWEIWHQIENHAFEVGRKVKEKPWKNLVSLHQSSQAEMC